MAHKRVEFMGWKNCIEISSGKLKLIVATEIGPRIRLSFLANVLFPAPGLPITTTFSISFRKRRDRPAATSGTTTADTVSGIPPRTRSARRPSTISRSTSRTPRRASRFMPDPMRTPESRRRLKSSRSRAIPSRSSTPCATATAGMSSLPHGALL